MATDPACETTHPQDGVKERHPKFRWTYNHRLVNFLCLPCKGKSQHLRSLSCFLFLTVFLPESVQTNNSFCGCQCPVQSRQKIHPNFLLENKPLQAHNKVLQFLHDHETKKSIQSCQAPGSNTFLEEHTQIEKNVSKTKKFRTIETEPEEHGQCTSLCTDLQFLEDFDIYHFLLGLDVVPGTHLVHIRRDSATKQETNSWKQTKKGTKQQKTELATALEYWLGALRNKHKHGLVLGICDSEDFSSQTTDEVDGLINRSEARDRNGCRLVDAFPVLHLTTKLKKTCQLFFRLDYSRSPSSTTSWCLGNRGQKTKLVWHVGTFHTVGGRGGIGGVHVCNRHNRNTVCPGEWHESAVWLNKFEIEPQVPGLHTEAQKKDSSCRRTTNAYASPSFSESCCILVRRCSWQFVTFPPAIFWARRCWHNPGCTQTTFWIRPSGLQAPPTLAPVRWPSHRTKPDLQEMFISHVSHYRNVIPCTIPQSNFESWG